MAICHNVAHNGHVIIVSVNAESAHIKHLGKTDIILGYGTQADLKERFGDDDAPCGQQEPTPDPLVRVCLNGEVESIPTSLQVALGLTVLGEGEGCPVTTPTTVVVEKEVIKEVPVEKIVEKVVEVPGPTQVVEITREVPAPAPAPVAPAAPAAPTGGELPKTGGSSSLPLIGAGVTALGVMLRRFFK